MQAHVVDITKLSVQESHVIFPPADGSVTLLFDFQGDDHMPPVIFLFNHLESRLQHVSDSCL